MTALLGLFNIVPGWIYAGLLAAAVATNCTTLHRLDTAKVDLSDLKAQHAEAARVAEAAARTKEQAFAAAITTTEQKASDEKKSLAAQLAAAHGELRNRPERPASGDVPKGPSDPVGCTGAQLYKPDAAFLVGESARADGLRIALSRCQAAYDAAVKLTSP